MASATSPPAPFTFLSSNQSTEHRTYGQWLTAKQRSRCGGFQVYATQEGPSKRQRAPPDVDTRIHWENEDEGWVGGSKSQSAQERIKADEKNLLDEKFSDLLNSSADSHYQLVFIFYLQKLCYYLISKCVAHSSKERVSICCFYFP